MQGLGSMGISVCLQEILIKYFLSVSMVLSSLCWLHKHGTLFCEASLRLDGILELMSCWLGTRSRVSMILDT